MRMRRNRLVSTSTFSFPEPSVSFGQMVGETGGSSHTDNQMS